MSRANNNTVLNVSEWRPRKGEFSGIHLSLNWFAAAAFICGATSPLVINIVGEIYVGELLLIQFAFLLLLLGGARRVLSIPIFGVFLQLVVLMLLGYLLSDIYRDARPAQFLRGWAKIILVSLDIVALVVVVACDKRNLWWFILGTAIGGVCDLVLREVPIMTVSGWKAGYSVPLVSSLACLSCFVSIRFAAVGFAALGVWNIFMDFRILGAICVFVAAILWLRSVGAKRLSGWRVMQIIVIWAFASSIVGSVMLTTQDEFAKRREQSNAGRGAGLSVAAWAIAESPLIGYGSWPMDARLVNLYYRELEEFGQSERGARINAFVAHSQILQGWVEGGVLGAMFWFYYGYWLIRIGWYVALRRPADAFLPVYLFFLTYDLWHLFMSPFAGSTRFLIAIGIAMICTCAAEIRANDSRRSQSRRLDTGLSNVPTTPSKLV